MGGAKRLLHHITSWHAQGQFYLYLITAVVPNILFDDAVSTVLCCGLGLHFASAALGVREDSNHLYGNPQWMGFPFCCK
jgi:hypothetical protein